MPTKKIEIRHVFSIDEESHPAISGNPEWPSSDYCVRPFTFLGELGQRADGCEFLIKPGGHTLIQRVVDPSVTIQEIAVRGKGYFLGVDPDGKLEFREVGPHLDDNNPLMELNEGWVICWFAGNKGLVVADVTAPAYNLKIEVEVKGPEDLDKPEFWEKFNYLTARR